MSHPDCLVRTLRTAARVPGAAAPYDTVHVAVRYPALPAQAQAERMSGQLAADPAGAPYPLAVVLPGVNVAAESYRWLAERLVAAGFVAVTFDWVAQLFPGQVGLTPGVDLTACAPDAYGSAPTTDALRPVLDAVARVADAGPLAGLLDPDRVGLIGHSAGGTVALQSASAEWFPDVRAVVTYGAHTMASTMLGYPAGTLLASPVTAPVLLVAGDLDGVVAASAVRYGEQDDAERRDPVSRTFEVAFASPTEVWLVRLAGATHMVLAHPEDPTTGRGFLEPAPATDAEASRATFADLATTFLRTHVCDDPAAKGALEALDPSGPDFAEIRRR